MARINLDDTIFREGGFQDLMIYVGNRHTAKGIVWELYELAQKYWFPEKRAIPLDKFEASGLPEALYAKGGLAVLREDGVYARGSEERFAWLFQKQKAGSKPKKKREPKPKKPKRDETGDNTRSTDEITRQTDANGSERDETDGNLLSLSSSLLSPSSNSDLSSQELKGEEKKAAQPSQAPVPAGKSAVAAYCEAYKSRYGQNPILQPKDAKALKTLGEQVGEEKAKQLVSAYLKMNNSWFITKSHDPITLTQNLNTVQNFLATGQTVTAADARNAEAGDSLKNQIERLGRMA